MSKKRRFLVGVNYYTKSGEFGFYSFGTTITDFPSYDGWKMIAYKYLEDCPVDTVDCLNVMPLSELENEDFNALCASIPPNNTEDKKDSGNIKNT